MDSPDFKILSHKKFNSLEQTLNFIPDHVVNRQYFCSQCKKTSSPDWLEKCRPYEPVPAPGGYWQMTQAVFNCAHCKSYIYIDLPTTTQKGHYYFFGDEAYREIGEHIYIGFSLIGFRKAYLERVNNLLNEIKSSLSPNEDVSWRIHMREIWPSDERKKHNIFKNWNAKDIENLTNKLNLLLHEKSLGIIVTNASCIVKKPGTPRHDKMCFKLRRREIYTMAIAQTIDEATQSGVKPTFFFDGDKKLQNGTWTQPWAADVFDSLKSNLVFPFISRGLFVDEPNIVQPGIHPASELADYVSFTLARYIHRSMSGSPIDLNPKQLGKIKYIGLHRSGDIRHIIKKGYPWQEFHGNS